ncbi:MAG: hypothetical protein K8T90_18985 [Planctomycetes bacterium]|nr:hypothetical protein [Planctomycetota bacterium]
MRAPFLVFPAAAVAAAALCVSCSQPVPDSPPGQSLRLMQRVVETQTWGPFWDTGLSLERRKRIDRATRRTLEANEKYRALAGDPSRALFEAMAPVLLKTDTTFAFESVADERANGARAEVRVKHRDGSMRGVTLVAEDGWWKLDSAEGSDAFPPTGAGAESVETYQLR